MKFPNLLLVLLFLPALSWAGNEVLLDETQLSALIAKENDYQLLDARNTEAQRSKPIAFSTTYRFNTPISNGLVMLVADDDKSAIEIAQSISASINRRVYAIQGGSEVWQKVMSNAPPSKSVSGSFVIPKNTCEQGNPIQKLQRNKPLQSLKNN